MPTPSRSEPRPAATAASRNEAGFWLYAGHLVTIWGIALSNILQGLAVLWTVACWRRPDWRPRWDWPRFAPLLVPTGIYACVLVLSIVFSLDPRVSLEDLDNVLALSTLVLALVWIRGCGAVRRVVDLVLAMIVILALYGIGQYYWTDYGGLDNRIPGSFSHYQTFAGVLMVGDLLLLARLAARDGWRRPYLWVALGIVNWALMLTLTRGPWVGVAITATAYVLIHARRWVLAYVAAGLVAWALMPASWVERIHSIGDLRNPSNYDRLCMLEAGLFMIEERPVLGLGPGMVRERYPAYRHPTAVRANVKHLHNTFVQMAAERGLLSLGAYLWLMLASLGLAYRLYRREGGPRGPRADLLLGVMMVLVGFNLAGLFEANWRDTEVQRLVLFILAIPICLRSDSPSSRRPSDMLAAASGAAASSTQPPDARGATS